MQRCVADVTGQGKELGAAFAICTAQSQKAGYSKPGSTKMTGKGAARERTFKNEPDMADKNAEYERAVQAGRKQEDTSMRALIRSLEEAAGGSIFVNTDSYVRNHGAKPKGRGNWGFGIGTSDPDMNSDDVFFANMLFSEAVKAAKAQAKKRGVNAVYVMP
jgi:hypothetical protein